MDKKIAWFIDEKNKRTSLEVGDVVIGHTGLKKDVYQKNDFQVISGKKKVGEAKERPGLCLEIFNQKEIAVIWGSHSGNKIFSAESKSGNIKYQFRSNLIQFLNVDEENKILAKRWTSQQLVDPEVTVDQITKSQYYSKFLEKNGKLKKGEPELEMWF